MRVSEAKSSGLFGNGARLPAIVLDPVFDIEISIQWKRVKKIRGLTGQLAVSRETRCNYFEVGRGVA
jgi:hypothetical protein